MTGTAAEGMGLTWLAHVCMYSWLVRAKNRLLNASEVGGKGQGRRGRGRGMLIPLSECRFGDMTGTLLLFIGC